MTTCSATHQRLSAFSFIWKDKFPILHIKTLFIIRSTYGGDNKLSLSLALVRPGGTQLPLANYIAELINKGNSLTAIQSCINRQRKHLVIDVKGFPMVARSFSLDLRTIHRCQEIQQVIATIRLLRAICRLDVSFALRPYKIFTYTNSVSLPRGCPLEAWLARLVFDKPLSP